MQKTISATKVLIVKTSSLGDVIQSFGVLEYLHKMNPEIIVDWVVDSDFHSIVAAHPLVRKAIPLSIRGLKKKWTLRNLWIELRTLRSEKYDVLFDLQKNTKSGFVTLAAKSKIKVGFGFKTVREWPNVLATNKRFNVPKMLHSNVQYVNLLQRYFNDSVPFSSNQVLFKIDESDRRLVQAFAKRGASPRMMICPGATGVNRQVPISILAAVLQQARDVLGAFFYLIWGDAEGKKQCEELQEALGPRCLIVERLSVPVWQNLMSEMDLVVAVDSSALHLCGTTKTPSFSFFGPTKASNVKPIGDLHIAVQGVCPYGKTFIRQCPIMRTCSTGACMRDLQADMIAKKLIDFYTQMILAGPLL
jgi:heptosyltransferase-1